MMNNISGVSITAAPNFGTFDTADHLKILTQPTAGAIIFSDYNAFILR